MNTQTTTHPEHETQSQQPRKSGLQLLLSDCWGIYIPKRFSESGLIDNFPNVIAYKDDLEDADAEFYWDTWDTVLNNAEHVDAEGHKWRLMQDGNLWAYCYELMTNEERRNFGFDEEPDEDEDDATTPIEALPDRDAIIDAMHNIARNLYGDRHE